MNISGSVLEEIVDNKGFISGHVYRLKASPHKIYIAGCASIDTSIHPNAKLIRLDNGSIFDSSMASLYEDITHQVILTVGSYVK